MRIDVGVARSLDLAQVVAGRGLVGRTTAVADQGVEIGDGLLRATELGRIVDDDLAYTGGSTGDPGRDTAFPRRLDAMAIPGRPEAGAHHDPHLPLALVMVVALSVH